MSKIHKIAWLIGMMILPMGLAIAAPYGGMGEMVLVIIFIPIFMGFIVPFYATLRLAHWIHGYALFKNKESMDTWIAHNALLLILDIPVFGYAFDIGSELYQNHQQKQERKRIYQERVQANLFNANPASRVTLNKAQKIAGIIMPKGTKIKLAQNLSPELPEYKKIDSATFPKPVMWNDIPITEISTYRDKMKISSDTQIQLGKWFCGNAKVLKGKKPQTVWDTTTKWKPLPDTMANLNDDNFEQSMYLHACQLTDAQTVHLPVFEISALSVSGELERGENNAYQNVNQGLWHVYGETSQLEIDATNLSVLVDSEKTVHGFSFKLRKPHEHCYLHENTLLAWHKSQPETFLVSHEKNDALYRHKPEYYQSCWFKEIQHVPLEEMQKFMSQ